MLLISSKSLVILSSFSSLVLSQTGQFAANLNPQGLGCADPKGYLSCYEQNAQDAAQCADRAPSTCPPDKDSQDACLASCGYRQLAANLACWLTSCWNMVNSCAYQGTAVQYLDGTDRIQNLTDIPFYPVKDGAPGACVCNIGQIWGTLTDVQLNGNACFSFITSIKDTADCECCLISSALSTIVDACPNNDLSAIPPLQIDTFITEAQGILANSGSIDNCAILSASPSACAATYSMDTAATSYYNPNSLPSGFPAKEPLSELAGSLTDSGSESYTFTIFPAYTSVITPVPLGKALETSGETGVKTSSGVDGGSGASQTGTGTSTAGSSETSKPSSATANSAKWLLLVVGVLVAIC